MSYWLIQKAHVPVSLQLHGKTAQHTISQALRALDLQPIEQPQGTLLEVRLHNQQWQLTDHSNDQHWALSKLGDLIYHLSDRIVFHLADQATDMHCVHAAAISDQGKTIVMPAQSGSGKSSFTCWMVQQGFDYVTDELVLLKNNGQMQGVARPIQIKSHGINIIKPMIKDQQGVYLGERINAISIDSLGGHTAQAPLTLAMLLFPTYQANAAYSLRALSSAEAGMSLMANYVNARNHPNHGFRQMMALVRTVPAYALTYSGFNTLPNDFIQQIKTKI